jgi:multisubunit Na+/H+ antiporter MnhE subunit
MAPANTGDKPPSEHVQRPSGRPSARRHRLARRAGVWLIWWILLMSGWIMLDNSLHADELLAGAGAAALAAGIAEVAGYQAATRPRPQIEWLVPAWRLPVNLLRDTGILSAALWRRLAHGADPDSEFREIPVRYGPHSMAGLTRRALLTAGKSFAPNTFVLGLESERGVLVVHQLVPEGEERRS